MITTAVIAAAGRGSRLLPFSAFVPKELIPLGSIPVIQYVVEELIEAGVTKIVVITDPAKLALVQFFDPAIHTAMIESIKNPILRQRQQKFAQSLEKIDIIIDYQTGKYGNASPLMNAKKHLKDEPFFYTWADDFISARPVRFAQLAEAYCVHQTTILSGVKARADIDYDLYAYVESDPLENGDHLLKRIHEKPGKALSPSNLGVLSGHLFDGSVLDFVERAYMQHDDLKGEFMFNDILHQMIAKGHKVIVHPIENADYIDAGNIDAYYDNFGKALAEKI